MQSPPTPTSSGMDSHFSCGICYDTFSVPYTIVDCLHKFDKDCLIQAWKVNASCMKLSTRAMYDFNLVSLMDAVLPNRSKPDNAQIITHEDITPFQPQGPPVGGGWGRLASDLGSEHFSDEEMDEDEDMDTLGDSPGGRLAWPCPSCSPGNVAGYTCDVPIPTPTIASIEAESRELGRPIRAPLPHEARVPIEGLVVEGANNHLQCDTCMIYVPRDYPTPMRCGPCRKVFCGPFSGSPICAAQALQPRNALVFLHNTVDGLVSTWPPMLRRNAVEGGRFQSYLQTTNQSVQNVLEELARLKHEQHQLQTQTQNQFGYESQGVTDHQPWAEDQWFCKSCVEMLVIGTCYQWWEEERARVKDTLPDEMKSLPDCWWGSECHTQRHIPVVGPDGLLQPTHASRFNHICRRTHQA